MRAGIFIPYGVTVANFSISRSQGLAPLSVLGYSAGLIDLILMLLSQAPFKMK